MSGCVGRLGFESFAAPTYFCHAARVRVDPATGIARATHVVAATDVGALVNPTGAIGQVTGGVVMALGNATLEGTRYGDDGRQRNPSLLDYKLLTSADAPLIEAIFVEHPASNGGPRGLEGGRRAADRADRRRRGERDRDRDRRPGPPPADDPGARLAGDLDRRRRGRGAGRCPRAAPTARRVRLVTTRFAAPTTVSAALAILATDRDARPVAGGTDLVVAARQGRKRLPESIVAIDRIAELQEARAEEGGLVLGALDDARLARRRRRMSVPAGPRSPTPPRSSDRRRRGARGTIGGNLMNASPAAETTGPLVVLGATVILRGQGGGERRVAVADLATGPGRTAAAPGELLTAVRVPRPRRAAAAPTSGSNTGGRWRSRSSARRPSSRSTATAGGTIADARIALTAVAPTIVRAPAAEAALIGRVADREAARGGRRGRRTPTPRRSTTSGRAPSTAARCSRWSSRRAVAAAVARARGETIPIPASRWAYGQEV